MIRIHSQSTVNSLSLVICNFTFTHFKFSIGYTAQQPSSRNQTRRYSRASSRILWLGGTRAAHHHTLLHSRSLGQFQLEISSKNSLGQRARRRTVFKIFARCEKEVSLLRPRRPHDNAMGFPKSSILHRYIRSKSPGLDLNLIQSLDYRL